MNVRWFTRECNPAERSAAFTKERANICGDKSWKIVCVLYALLECERPNVVSVIECDGAHLLQTQHAFYVTSHRIQRSLFVSARVAFSQFQGFVKCQAIWNVTIQRIVSRRLVSED